MGVKAEGNGRAEGGRERESKEGRHERGVRKGRRGEDKIGRRGRQDKEIGVERLG